MLPLLSVVVPVRTPIISVRLSLMQEKKQHNPAVDLNETLKALYGLCCVFGQHSMRVRVPTGFEARNDFDLATHA